LLAGMLNAYSSSNPQTTQYGSSLSTQSQSFCQQGSDFVVELAPFGCSPAVVRSDLLEENNVPVYCQLSALKINPLIDVKSIDSITFSGKYSQQVSGVAFYPAKAALSKGDSNEGSASLNNIGYVVIMLKKQSNESAMPDFVAGNLTAKIKYDVDTAFGIGNGVYYLPEFSSDNDWEQNKNKYSFWNGKGYLQAENIEADNADISVYSATNKLTTVSLEKGKTSNSVYLPGFECQAGLKITLQDIQNPDTRARLRINSDIVEVGKGEKFLDNKCTVQSLNKKGIVEEATIKCKEDSKTTTHSLVISPKVILNINGIENEYSLGDRLYQYNDKQVYLGYVGTKGGSKSSKDLFIFLYAVPSSQGLDKLSDNQLKSVSSLIANFVNVDQKFSVGAIALTNELLSSFSALVNLGVRGLVSGEDFQGISVSDGEHTLLGQKIKVVGFAGTEDIELDDSTLEYYESAKADYEEIQSSFPDESYSQINSYGEEALYNQIVLAFDAGQKTTASSLCESFKTNYPNSLKETSDYCGDAGLSNSEVQGIYVTINKQTMKISFDGIYEPSIKEFGAYVSVANADDYSGQSIISKNQKVYVSSTEYFSLIGLDDDSATIDVSNIQGTISDELFKTGKATVNLNNFIVVGKKNYKISLNQINLKKVAKVSLKSNIDNTGTQSNFSFKIGIEKRASILTPSVVEGLITNLSNDIKTWQGISDGLDKVNKVLKTSCIATGAALVVKNFIFGTDGTGISRKTVMSGKGGWSSICAEKVSAQEYVSLDQCYLDNAGKIDADVSTYNKFLTSQNNEIKKIEGGVTTTSTFGEKVVDTDKFMTGTEGYIETAKENINKNTASTISDPSGIGSSVNVDSLMNTVLTSEGYNSKVYSVEQLKEIELYSQIANDASVSEELKNIAKQNLYSTLVEVQSNANTFQQAVQAANILGVDTNKITFLETKGSKALSYEGLKDNSGNPVAYVQTTTGVYIVTLDDSAGTSTLPIKQEKADGKLILQIKDSSGDIVTDPVVLANFQNVYFKKYDSATYKNGYKNPELSYYETEPYAGLPAIVPFDKTNGWYASISQTIATGNNLAAYSASGKVTSFWVCNVGPNGLEENKGGDDICEMINTGTGQPYNQFPGLSEADATKKINDANKAIEQASNAYSSSKSGTVKILGETFKIGAPAADIPDFQCQDFMSPTDCNLLFNLCDPVICPSSRCDLGGTYPVKDVVQTGIVGSLVLCLPNIQEGILLPVCLTGVKSGIDGLISVQKSYRDCLNESLRTGKMVGICDEVYSIYLCDFFWKQAIPLANMIVPAILTTLSGQNVHGGGEYLSVSSAWGTAEQSVNYLVNYYGANAKSAFVARSSETIEDEVCKLYTSATVPTGGDFFDTLIQTDSPPQYTARFDEMPFTTATATSSSQYKIYFHIYAGKDAGAYYQVYLKGSSESTYYKDTSQSVAVNSGYIPVGSEVDKTRDIIASSGYKQLCINVNGEEECGFKQVSTSFLVDYTTQSYVSNEANKTGITKASDCISGTANIYSLLVNLNAQAAAESLINPAIYNQGIIRVCATADPGKGTDSYSGTENSRWKSVGYCDEENLKCWIDTNSIKEVLSFTDLENSTISSLSENYAGILSNEYGYLTGEQFDSAVKEIKSTSSPSERVSLVNEIIEKVFLNNEKAELLLLRGNAYGELLKALLRISSETTAQEENQTSVIPTQTAVTSPSVSSSTVVEGVDTSKLSAAQKAVFDSTKALVGTSASRTIYSSCWDGAYQAYRNAKVIDACAYSDISGKSYTIANEKGLSGHSKPATIITELYTGAKTYNNGKTFPDFAVYSGCVNKNLDMNTKLSNIKTGDLLSYAWRDDAGHSAIFIRWEDEANRIAYLFDWNGGTSSNRIFRYYTEDLSDSKHPVYVYWNPSTNGKATTDMISNLPTNSQSDFFTTTSSSSLSASTISEKIYEHAKKYADASSTTSSTDLVVNSIKAAGIAGISASTPSDLASSLKGSSNFYEIDIDTNLQKGDIVFISKDCQTDYAVGIVESVVSGPVNYVYVYTNVGSKVQLQSFTVFTSPQYKLLAYSTYKAYRYGNKADQISVSPWTITSALDKISNSRLEGSYTDNMVFMNQLVFDGILTQKECDTMKGTGLFAFQKDILWLKTLLLSKQVSMSTYTPTSASTTTAEKIYLHAQKYVDASSTIDSTALVVNSLKAAGVTISASSPSGLATSLKNNPSLFYEVDITKSQKEGDIVLIGKGCQVSYAAGILGAISTEDSPSRYVNLYTNVGSKVTTQTIVVSPEILSGNYVYKAYRYIGDLSDAQKEAITQRTPFTITSALEYIQKNNLQGSYSNNKQFMSSVVFDRLLSETECDTMDGGFLTPAKDITWLKQLLISKQ
jgi:hypothetical protein